MTTRSLIVAAAALWLNACAPAEQINEIAGEIDGQSLVFTPVTAAAELDNNHYHLDIQGTVGNGEHHSQLNLNLVINAANISKADAGTRLVNFKGDSWFASNPAQPQWFPSEHSDKAVVAAWAEAGCRDCAGIVNQHVNGSLDIHFSLLFRLKISYVRLCLQAIQSLYLVIQDLQVRVFHPFYQIKDHLLIYLQKNFTLPKHQ